MTFKLKVGLWKCGEECARQRKQEAQKPQGRNKAAMSAGVVIRNDIAEVSLW